MGKVETLEKIEREVAEGKLGIALDRLHGLSLTYPEDLSLRSRQGDIYSILGQPIEAGRCWILDEDSTEEKTEAIDVFLRSCNHHPVAILKRLRVRCEPDDLTTEAGRQKIKELIRNCNIRGRKAPVNRNNFRSNPPGLLGNIVGIVLMIVIACAIFVAGLVSTYEWIKSFWN